LRCPDFGKRRVLGTSARTTHFLNKNLALARHLQYRRVFMDCRAMTLKIEIVSRGGAITVRLVGRIETAHLPELETQVRRHGSRLAFDLDEVTLVDSAVVRFLCACEADGIELRSAAPYIRAWIERERSRQS
jgi:hypothetical protein